MLFAYLPIMDVHKLNLTISIMPGTIVFQNMTIHRVLKFSVKRDRKFIVSSYIQIYEKGIISSCNVKVYPIGRILHNFRDVFDEFHKFQ